jgi:hypothetical protein
LNIPAVKGILCGPPRPGGKSGGCKLQQDHFRLARRSVLLASAPEEVAQGLLAAAHTRSFDRGATIFLQGERASAIYIVAEGWVKLYRIAPSGAEAVVGVFTKGASFGEAVAFRHDTYPVAAEAATDCTLIRIEADAFLRRIRENPEIAISMLSATYRPPACPGGPGRGAEGADRIAAGGGIPAGPGALPRRRLRGDAAL